MPTRAEHLKQARANADFCRSTAGAGNHLDWVATAAFYCALHAVDAYFATLATPLHPGSHVSRDRHVSLLVPPIWAEYRLLKDESIDARYNCTATPIGLPGLNARVFPAVDKVGAEISTRISETVFPQPLTPPPAPPAVASSGGTP